MGSTGGRSQFARLIAQKMFEAVTGRIPTNFELANALISWKLQVQDYPPVMQEAVRQQCNPLFEEADLWSEEHRAPLPERLDGESEGG